MTSGPMPPSAPSRTIPSASIQKWTGSAIASHASARLPSLSSPSGNVAFSPSPKAATAPSSSLTSIAMTTSPVVGVARREPVHQRELVLAGPAPGRHEVDPDRLARAGSRDRSSRRRPGARPAPAPAGRRGTGPSATLAEAPARRSAERRRRPTGSRSAIAIGGLGVAPAAGPGRTRGAPRAPAPRRRRRPRGRRRSTGVPTCARRVPVRAVGGAFGGTAATMPVPWRPSRSYPHADRPGAPDGARRHLPRRRAPVVHDAGRRGSAARRRPRRATPRRRRRRDAEPADHPAAARFGARPPPASPTIPPRPGRHPGAHRRAQDRPRRSSTSRTGFPACNVAMYSGRRGSASRARARRSTSTPTPGPGCSCRC